MRSQALCLAFAERHPLVVKLLWHMCYFFRIETVFVVGEASGIS
jgi:hypothetical protein